MEYVISLMTIIYHHASRSVLLTELPSSSWLRGEHVLGHHEDGSPRCIACCIMLCPTPAGMYTIPSPYTSCTTVYTVVV